MRFWRQRPPETEPVETPAESLSEFEHRILNQGLWFEEELGIDVRTLKDIRGYHRQVVDDTVIPFQIETKPDWSALVEIFQTFDRESAQNFARAWQRSLHISARKSLISLVLKSGDLRSDILQFVGDNDFSRLAPAHQRSKRTQSLVTKALAGDDLQAREGIVTHIENPFVYKARRLLEWRDETVQQFPSAEKLVDRKIRALLKKSRTAANDEAALELITAADLKERVLTTQALLNSLTPNRRRALSPEALLEVGFLDFESVSFEHLSADLKTQVQKAIAQNFGADALERFEADLKSGDLNNALVYSLDEELVAFATVSRPDDEGLVNLDWLCGSNEALQGLSVLNCIQYEALKLNQQGVFVKADALPQVVSCSTLINDLNAVGRALTPTDKYPRPYIECAQTNKDYASKNIDSNLLASAVTNCAEPGVHNIIVDGIALKVLSLDTTGISHLDDWDSTALQSLFNSVPPYVITRHLAQGRHIYLVCETA